MKDINDILKDLGARQQGDYYILYCPHCGKREAYCYISDMIKWQKDNKHLIPIRCNRLNKCGQISYLNDFFDKEEMSQKFEIKEESPIQMSKEGITYLQKFCKYVIQDIHCNTNDFNFDLRGISNQTLKDNGFIYYKGTFQKIIESKPELFGDKYRSANYLDRDIIIPIMNKDGIVERLLLRSLNQKTKQKSYKKEIQVMLKKRGMEIWNVKDIYNDSKEIIFITEGVYDALSILEVNDNPKVGVISIPGVRKYKQILQILHKFPKGKEKTFVFALDNDLAGIETKKKAIKDFQENNIKTLEFHLKSFKDCNEFLQEDRKGLYNQVREVYNYEL